MRARRCRRRRASFACAHHAPPYRPPVDQSVPNNRIGLLEVKALARLNADLPQLRDDRLVSGVRRIFNTSARYFFLSIETLSFVIIFCEGICIVTVRKD